MEINRCLQLKLANTQVCSFKWSHALLLAEKCLPIFEKQDGQTETEAAATRELLQTGLEQLVFATCLYFLISYWKQKESHSSLSWWVVAAVGGQVFRCFIFEWLAVMDEQKKGLSQAGRQAGCVQSCGGVWSLFRKSIDWVLNYFSPQTVWFATL